MTLSRRELVRARFVRHGLHRERSSLGTASEVAALDYGVQDTGTDGAAWALSLRGTPAAVDGELAYAWTLRGAPHAYRRVDLAAVAVAVAPWSEADAAKRIFDAAKPLKAAELAVLEALVTVADQQRKIVTKPTTKGEVSSRLSEVLPEPYLRSCRACDTIHIYEQPFRLAALQAGLELEARTSPPVLRRVPKLRPNRCRRLAGDADDHLDVVRNHLRFYPGASQRDVAQFLDAPLSEVKARWPAEAVPLTLSDLDDARGSGRRFALEADIGSLATAAAESSGAVRLLGPYDPYLQLRDRALLVVDEARRKELWPVLGRPGAVVVGGEVAGTWRPKTSGSTLTVTVAPWDSLTRTTRAGIEAESERLAEHRGTRLAAVAIT